MTPCEKSGYMVNDLFINLNDGPMFGKLSIIKLVEDDGSENPVFELVTGHMIKPAAHFEYNSREYSLKHRRCLSDLQKIEHICEPKKMRVFVYGADKS